MSNFTPLKIHRVLKDIGMCPAYTGYDYVTEAIMLHESGNEKMMYVYQTIAKTHNVTQASVERAIRHAISASIPRANITLARSIFGMRFDKNVHLTCSEYIRCVVYYLREM